jgi:hypothetical protein
MMMIRSTPVRGDAFTMILRISPPFRVGHGSDRLAVRNSSAHVFNKLGSAERTSAEQ